MRVRPWKYLIARIFQKSTLLVWVRPAEVWRSSALIFVPIGVCYVVTRVIWHVVAYHPCDTVVLSHHPCDTVCCLITRVVRCVILPPV